MADDSSGDQVVFRTSSFSGGGNCVEVGYSVPGDVSVQHSTAPGTSLTFTGEEWDAFVAGVKNGEFDRPAG